MSARPYRKATRFILERNTLPSTVTSRQAENALDNDRLVMRLKKRWARCSAAARSLAWTRKSVHRVKAPAMATRVMRWIALLQGRKFILRAKLESS